MIKISFTKEKIEQLHYERFHYPHPRVQMKMEALYLKSLGYKHKDIAKNLCLTETTVREYFQEYSRGGIEALKKFCPQKHPGSLEIHTTTLKEIFEKEPPSTAKSARKKIFHLTGIKRCPTQVRQFLKKNGFKYLMAGQIPSKANPVEQEVFLEEKLKPILEEAKEKKRHVFFMDASHFVMGAYLASLWCIVRIFIKTSCGRQRYNVLGALNAITHQVVTFTNDQYINSYSVVELLKKISQEYAGLPITIVLDNAKYQRNKFVMAEAVALGIDLLFLPTYSPNLNLIERLWKNVKSECLYSKHYESFADFKNAINSCISNDTAERKKELSSLLALNFQKFKVPA